MLLKAQSCWDAICEWNPKFGDIAFGQSMGAYLVWQPALCPAGFFPTGRSSCCHLRSKLFPPGTPRPPCQTRDPPPTVCSCRHTPSSCPGPLQTHTWTESTFHMKISILSQMYYDMVHLSIREEPAAGKIAVCVLQFASQRSIEIPIWTVDWRMWYKHIQKQRKRRQHWCDWIILIKRSSVQGEHLNLNASLCFNDSIWWGLCGIKFRSCLRSVFVCRGVIWL